MTTYEIYCSLKKEKGVSDADVAKSTGIGKSTFSDWKSGRSKPKYEKLIRIADFFNVPYTFLIGKTEDRSKEKIAHDKICGQNFVKCQFHRAIISLHFTHKKRAVSPNLSDLQPLIYYRANRVRKCLQKS